MTLCFRRTHSLLAPIFFVFGASSVVCPARAQDAKAADPLPVRSVTLFSSGVSYTLREGEVSGDAQVPLVFRTSQINDILKSLVLLDEKGTVQPAIYGAKDPIGRTLQSFAVDVSRPQNRSELLNKLRGARVTVETGANGGPKETLTGQIVGVETQPGGTENGNERPPIELLTILGDAGIQSVRLDTVRAIRLADERLNREFREALTLLAAGSDDKRRSVQLHFAGDGRRRVRVGYVSEAPLWKISYRLLLGGTEAEKGATASKPYLQGWALVENTTDDDWNGVRLSLVSGQPVSFIQDLYQPLYLPRPIVPPDVVASPFPQLAEGAVETSPEAVATNAPPPPPATPAVSQGGMGGGGFGGRDASSARKAERIAPGAAGLGNLISTDADNSLLNLNESLRNSVAAQASGTRAGELFQYNITTPVSLPRQQAAMIPVIAQEIGGEKVSLYNADTGPRFPLSAFRVRNNTPLHLKGGPITIFDNGVYAGDARMEDVPPGDNRLVTYAVDLSIEGDRQGGNSVSTEGAIAIRRGVLITTRTERIETVYTFRSKADRPRTILVEHPYQPDFKLVQPPQALERTGNLYRFSLDVPPGKTEKLTVQVERPVSEQVGLVNANINFLEAYVTRRNISEELKTALREVQRRRRTINDLQNQATVAEAEIAAIDKDQDRIRKNMNALDKASALYKRYVTQLDQQETRIQALRTEASRLQASAGEGERDLRAYLDTLDVKP